MSLFHIIILGNFPYNFSHLLKRVCECWGGGGKTLYSSIVMTVKVEVWLILMHNILMFWVFRGWFFFFTVMQCGFAFLEAGAVRSKNTTNILIKNVMDLCKLIHNQFNDYIRVSCRLLKKRLELNYLRYDFKNLTL